MKRFYKEVSTAPAEGGFAVLLDGKPVKTPGRNGLTLPTSLLAEAVAQEWRAQGQDIHAATMPLLRLVNTVIDGVFTNRAEVIGAVLRFGENDLVCYRAHQPLELLARQRQGWDRWLDWVRQRHGVHLTVVEGLNPVDQSLDALLGLRRAVEELDDFCLGALHVIVSITGSLVLGLAVAQGVLKSEEAFQLSRIDEIYQAEKWGADGEAAKRSHALALELNKAVELIALVHAQGF
jgi:chaperone required for assembly of F1-ATPase